MRKLLVGMLAFGLLTGCSNSVEKPAEPKEKVEAAVVKKKPVQETGTLKEALKKFHNIKVKEVTDARKTTGHINLVVSISEEVGAGSYAGGVFGDTQDFIKTLKEKPKTITVGVMQGDIRVLQYTTDVAKFKPMKNEMKAVFQASTIEKQTPEVEKFIKLMSRI
ncbi:hypothetical protein V7128_05620 [Neobacillus vireti]|uniref:hypothetical protein n=1 Tax=Neobacillus vireti TaxID=220686 RepID=UPI0030009F25